jgi:ketosteroid isomerase-like protein
MGDRAATALTGCGHVLTLEARAREVAMTHPNEDLIRNGYAAYARGDINALREDFLAPDVRWHFPGTSPLAGHHQGADTVAGFFGLMGQLSGGTHRLELHDVLANDDHVVALHTAWAQRAGRRLEINAALILHVTDGKVTEAWTLHDDPPAVDEFWS